MVVDVACAMGGPRRGEEGSAAEGDGGEEEGEGWNIRYLIFYI